MKKRFFIRLIILVFLLGLLPIQAALADSDDVAIAKQFTYPTGDIYCSIDANTMRTMPDRPGYMLGESTGSVKAYVIFVDFEDCPGAPEYPTAQTQADPLHPWALRNIFTQTSGGVTYTFDYSKPQYYYNNIFKGLDKGGRKFGEGVIEYFQQVSCGKMNLNVVCPNSQVLDKDGNWTWFRLPGSIKDYEIQFAAPEDAEDYRAEARLFQAGIDIAHEYIPTLDMSDIKLIYVAAPINTYGGRQGLSGGWGIDTSFTYQDQYLLYKHYNVNLDTSKLLHNNLKMYDGRKFGELSVQDPLVIADGAVCGSGVIIAKGIRGYSGADLNAYRVICHETCHSIGFTDDYNYDGGDHYVTGWSGGGTAPCTGNWGIMGEAASMTGAATPDPLIWNKFKSGWIDDKHVTTIMPGESKTVKILASGATAANLALAGITDGVKMVLLPTDLRTIDVLWPDRLPNARAVHANGTIFGFLEWFTPNFLNAFAPDVEMVTSGSVTHPSRRVTFPTGYTLECRRAIGADSKNTAATAGNKGTLITQISNITWETGLGAASFKVVRIPANAANCLTSCLAAAGSGYSNNSTWTDSNRGITVKVTQSASLYDVVEITYAKNTRPYIGELKINNGATARVWGGNTVSLPFDLRTIGEDVTTGTPNPTPVAGRTGSPLGVPEGVSSFGATVTYDPACLEYAGLDKVFASGAVDDTVAGKLQITAADPQMVKGLIMSLKFKALTTVPYGTSQTNVSVTFNSIGLLDFRGNAAPITSNKITVKGGQVEIWNPILGDVNEDGAVTLADAILVLQYLAGQTNLTTAQLFIADVNKDGEVDQADVDLILALAGIVFSGAKDMLVYTGYKAVSTSAYTVTGLTDYTITQNIDYSGKITFNSATAKLGIAEGLTPGTYPVKLTLWDTTSQLALTSLTFTLTMATATAYNYNVYLKPHATTVAAGATFYVDVVIIGNINYTQVTADITFDGNLLQYVKYDYLSGAIATCVQAAPNKITLRSVPSTNMVLGGYCASEVTIATLKFTALNTFAPGNTIYVSTATVSAPAGFIGATVATSKPVI